MAARTEVPPDFKELEEHLQSRAQQQSLPENDTGALARALASRWYQKNIVKPVIVDVVSEFVVQELVAIDGDSLLSLCFDQAASLADDESSQALGYQPLTLLYLFEQYLAKFRSANLFFKIVWFDDRSAVSCGAGSKDSPVSVASRKFVRRSVRSHLAGLDVSQVAFSSISSDEWHAWLDLERPYAILVTDGPSQAAAGLREAMDTLAIAQHLAGGLDGKSQGVSVVLMDASMLVDHKIVAFMLETTPLARHAVHLQQEPYQKLVARITQAQSADDGVHVPSVDANVQDVTLAERIALAAASNAQSNTTHRTAIVLASVLLPLLPLEARALRLESTALDRAASDFLASAYVAATSILASQADAAASSANLLDPRLFAFLVAHLDSVANGLPVAVQQRSASLCKAAGLNDVPALASAGTPEHAKSLPKDPSSSTSLSKLLPYNPPASIEVPDLPTSDQAAPRSEPSSFLPRLAASVERAQLAASSSFSQYKRSGKDKAVRDQHGRIINKLASRRFKADQRYAAWIAAYAQSLLGSAGLTRQVITEGAVATLNVEDKKKVPAGGKDKKGGKGGDTKKLSKKEQIIAQNQARKSDKASAQVERKLVYLLEELEIGPAVSKFDSADSDMLEERRRNIAALAPYLASASSAEAARDLRLLKVRLAVEGWVCACTIEKKKACYDLAVIAFTEIGQILAHVPADKFDEHEKALLTSCGQALRILGLQGVYGPSHAGLEKVWDEVEEKKGKPKKGEFPFDVNWPRASKKYVVGDAIDFQLDHCGDVMDRQLDSKVDKRVATFKPDGWQRRVLDAVDAKENLLVVAPTSAGKTFIAFYCIEKALRESSDAVVVYVAPSKALVNQIAAELEARYSKNYGATERTVWSISTGEFDVHNPLKAQVLVAAPSVLHKMCLQSDVIGSWLPRVKAVIVDEVHTLTDMELGPTQQQLLGMIPAPIIALSATIGNVDEFGEWFSQVRAQHGQKVSIVQHPTRYSDLKKHVFLPPSVQQEKEGFQGITKPVDSKLFRHLHPFSALRPLGVALPTDLEMTPSEQLQLAKAMQKFADADAGYSFPDELDPQAFFGSIVGPLTRAHTLAYQAALRKTTQAWMDQGGSREEGSPFIQVIDILEGGLTAKMDAADRERKGGLSHIEFQKEHLLPLLSGMHQKQLLPALFFNFGRDAVETLGKYLVDELVGKEAHYKGTNKTWLAKVKEWEQWQADEPSRRKAEEKRLKAIKGREEAEALKKDAQKSDAGWQASFDPDAPLADFTFANEKCGEALEDIVPQVEHLPNLDEWVRQGLIRGVAIHHTGMPLRYRQTVERWFRKGWLRVVICTGSLALGINMPAKTSVFVGDHLELNALQYRQAAGRAGRRGMDLSGNVFFYGIPMRKIHRLLTSRLPSLDCDFPSTATLNLRLHSLLADSSSKKAGEKMIQSITKLPQPPSRTAELSLAHQFRGSVEFLRRFGLMSADGMPLALSGLAAHLALSEPANLAFIELLRSGCLYNIAASAETNRIQAVDDFVTVLSHLFASRPVNPTSRFEEAKDSLPALPAEARQVLEKLNAQAKAAYLDYAAAVDGSSRHEAAVVEAEALPYSKQKVGGTDADAADALAAHRIPHRLRSSFVSACGAGDCFDAVRFQDAAASLRSGLSMTPSAIPNFDRFLDASRPRNAYVLDFFRQGNLLSLVSVHGIPGRALAWSLLNDFWQVLLALRASLELLLKTGAKTLAQGAGRGTSGAATPKSPSSEVDDWEFDPPEKEQFQGFDEDGLGGGGGGGDDDDDDRRTVAATEYKTDSGIAGSQMSMSTQAAGGAGRTGPQVHRAGEVRTRSGKRVDPIDAPVEIPAHLRNAQLWAVYKLLWDVMSQYHARFFATFA
ncbi:unnamed protein product [Parajaminaea phylloscopi]